LKKYKQSSLFFKQIEIHIMPTYRILLTEEPEGGYTVLVPALPGCITYGDNINHAKEMAKEAIEGYLEVLKERGHSCTYSQ
jgi:predicted RNase H-like HicB family nuclease